MIWDLEPHFREATIRRILSQYTVAPVSSLANRGSGALRQESRTLQGIVGRAYCGTQPRACRCAPGDPNPKHKERRSGRPSRERVRAAGASSQDRFHTTNGENTYASAATNSAGDIRRMCSLWK